MLARAACASRAARAGQPRLPPRAPAGLYHGDFAGAAWALRRRHAGDQNPRVVTRGAKREQGPAVREAVARAQDPAAGVLGRRRSAARVRSAPAEDRPWGGRHDRLRRVGPRRRAPGPPALRARRALGRHRRRTVGLRTS